MNHTSSPYAVPQPAKPLEVARLTPKQALEQLQANEGRWCRLIPVDQFGNRYSNLFAKEVAYLEGAYWWRRDSHSDGVMAQAHRLVGDYLGWDVEVIEGAYLE